MISSLGSPGTRYGSERGERFYIYCIYVYIYITGWWFQTFFIFHNRKGILLAIDFHIFQDG